MPELNLSNFNLFGLNQVLSIPKDMGADVFNSICLNESSVHPIHTYCIVLEDDRWIHWMDDLALFGQDIMHRP